MKLVEEKVTGNDEASQALISPHDIDELERQRDLEQSSHDYRRLLAWESRRQAKLDEQRRQKTDPEAEHCTF